MRIRLRICFCARRKIRFHSRVRLRTLSPRSENRRQRLERIDQRIATQRVGATLAAVSVTDENHRHTSSACRRDIDGGIADQRAMRGVGIEQTARVP